MLFVRSQKRFRPGLQVQIQAEVNNQQTITIIVVEKSQHERFSPKHSAIHAAFLRLA